LPLRKGDTAKGKGNRNVCGEGDPQREVKCSYVHQKNEKGATAPDTPKVRVWQRGRVRDVGEKQRKSNRNGEF